jgi:ABC-2 type transport system permease protein
MILRQLRSELWKLFGKKRTYIGFGAFLLAQAAMLLMFQHSGWQRSTSRLLEGNGYLAGEYLSALTVAVIMLIPQILLLMPLYASLVGGDMVAKEAEDGTLRMILCRPISRLRLLAVKWVAGLCFCVALVAALGAMAVLMARIWFPWGGLFVNWPPLHVFALMPAGEGLLRYGLAHTLLAINAMTVFSLAFMFSCFNMKPAAATVLGMTFLLANLVLENLPFFEDYKAFCLTQYFKCWLMVFNQPVPLPDIFKSLCVIAGFNATAFIVGFSGFHVRDIKS